MKELITLLNVLWGPRRLKSKKKTFLRNFHPFLPFPCLSRFYRESLTFSCTTHTPIAVTKTLALVRFCVRLGHVFQFFSLQLIVTVGVLRPLSLLNLSWRKPSISRNFWKGRHNALRKDYDLRIRSKDNILLKAFSLQIASKGSPVFWHRLKSNGASCCEISADVAYHVLACRTGGLYIFIIFFTFCGVRKS